MNKIKKYIRNWLVVRNQNLLDDKLRKLQSIRKESEILEIIKFRESHGSNMIPYAFVTKVKQDVDGLEIKQGFDESYVVVSGNKIYYPKKFSLEEIKNGIYVALIEQHDESPHRYEHNPSAPLSGDTAVLIGASDCVFASTIAKRFKRLILVEPNEQWHPTMRMTLDALDVDYSILKCFIGSENSGVMLTLDKALESEEGSIDFVQADIEGAEISMLLGSEQTMKRFHPKFSVCCYHTPWQEAEVKDFFISRGYSVSHSPGYIEPMTAKPLQYPYLRRGVVYAESL